MARFSGSEKTLIWDWWQQGGSMVASLGSWAGLLRRCGRTVPAHPDAPGALRRSTRLPITLPQDNTPATDAPLSTTVPTNPALVG